MIAQKKFFMEVLYMENKNSTLKILFIVVGAIVCLGTAAVLVYTFFKKHFKVTFACDGCDCCDEFDDFAVEEVDEPICCCCEEEAACTCGEEACDAE